MRGISLVEEIIVGAWFCKQKFLLFCDSQCVIHLGKNSNFYNRSKHINIRYNWMWDVLDDGLLELAKVHTYDNGFDVITKTIPRWEFETYCEIFYLVITSA